MTVTLEYVGEEDLTGQYFETLHVKETLDENGTVLYDVETVNASMKDVTKPVMTYKVVPVYETREITEERTTMVTKTREVEKTKTVKVKVAFKLFDPSTWSGYKNQTQKYTVTETYEEPVTETVVIGTEEVQVGTETVEDGTEEIVVGQTAVFTADEFSTFTVTWGSNEGNSVTVHHGYMANGAFVEFTAADSLNPNNYPNTRLRARDYSSGQFAYLIYDFKDYQYSATYRTNGQSANPTTGTAVRPTLRANGGTNNANNRVWQTQTTANNYSNLNNGNHVYVVYTPRVATQGYTPSEDDDPDTPDTDDYVPDVEKVVSAMKEDGTYDITLSVIGHEDSSEKVVKARVIVVFDVSGSMAWGMGGQGSGGASRLSLAKSAVNSMAEELLKIEDSQGNKLVELGLVTFSSDATKRQFGGQDFTSTYSTYNGVINSLNANGGTNWEAALNLANSMQASANGKTYIVFVSDGNPTFRTSRDDLSDAGVRGDAYDYNNGTIRFGTGQTGSATETPCYNTAVIAAQSIVDHNKTLYTVGLSSDASKLENMATATGGTYFDGSDEETFVNNMKTIASAISSEVGLSDVEITDGVTEMSQVATDALIGTTGNFIYRKGTNTDISQNPIWEGAPEATLNSNNSVVWDLKSAGTLENGVIHSVTFTVWPKQEAQKLSSVSS